MCCSCRKHLSFVSIKTCPASFIRPPRQPRMSRSHWKPGESGYLPC
uniref:Uncharacterized protein n=1 Tax=Rhizophora mucronata TaxID=61149 RepID=A0A2P2PC20_RHIMU